MACKHWCSRLDITITRQMTVVGNEDEIRQNEPVSMRVAVSCPDCGFSAIFNANNGRYPGTRWPLWLHNRLISLRARNAAVQEACFVCDVPPTTHASF
jgi:hypothetical protein